MCRSRDHQPQADVDRALKQDEILSSSDLMMSIFCSLIFSLTYLVWIGGSEKQHLGPKNSFALTFSDIQIIQELSIMSNDVEHTLGGSKVHTKYTLTLNLESKKYEALNRMDWQMCSYKCRPSFPRAPVGAKRVLQKIIHCASHGILQCSAPLLCLGRLRRGLPKT